MPSTDTICKIESVKSVHSELDIKDESPMYESNPTITSHYEQSSYGPVNPQQNYYYVMPQNPETVPQGPIVQGVMSQTPPGAYYMRPYIMQTPRNKFLPSEHQQQPIYRQQSPQIMITQSYINNSSYVPYVTQPQAQYPQAALQPNLQNPLYSVPKPQNRHSQNNKSATPRQNSQHPNGAATKNNSTPVRGRCQRSANSKVVKGDVPPQPLSKPRRRPSQISSTENNKQKVTSLIMLSDSDDEIEMIIMEKETPTTIAEKASSTDRVRKLESQRIAIQSKQKPTITSDITVPSTKGILSPQIIQRMSQGGISITPVKNNPPSPTTNANTQLVVVVNETGSHYALALPNGSKLILTPEQVAQIRASNGGKLIL